MILLDLEYYLVQFNDKLKTSGIQLPGVLFTPNLDAINIQNYDFSSSIFRILILDEYNISFNYTYQKIENFNIGGLYYTSVYIPDPNGNNILNLTSNDIQYITELNNGTSITIDPDSDFLLAHKYIDTYTPNTLLGKIIKLIQNLKVILNPPQPIVLD